MVEKTIKRTSKYKITKRTMSFQNGSSAVLYAVYDKRNFPVERFVSRLSDAQKIAKKLK